MLDLAKFLIDKFLRLLQIFYSYTARAKRAHQEGVAMRLGQVNVISVRLLALVLACSVATTGCQTVKGVFGKGKKDDISATQARTTQQGYYSEAQNYIAKGSYARATATLKDLRTFYPAGEYAEQALLDQMYAEFQHGDYLDAVASAERFIQSYPSNPQIAYAYYVRGVANMQVANDGLSKYTNLNPAHQDMGYYRVAFANLQELIARYPNSQYAPDAALRLRYMYNLFAEHEMNIARWYIKRQAYVASANRAKWVFQYYPQSEATPEAIATLAYSYQQLGMTDTARQYQQLLAINYPQLLDRNGNVRLEDARTGSSWLNKATLGLLGQSATNRDLSAIKPDATKTATKTQVIQPSLQQQAAIQQAASLRLANADVAPNAPTATPNTNLPNTPAQEAEPVAPNPLDNINFGLGLPPDNTSPVK